MSNMATIGFVLLIATMALLMLSIPVVIIFNSPILILISCGVASAAMFCMMVGVIWEEFFK